MTNNAPDALVQEAAAANENRNEHVERAGRAIAALLDTHHWTADEVVEHTGITRSTAYRWSAPFRTRKSNGGAA